MKPTGQRQRIARVAGRAADALHSPGIDPELDALLLAIVTVLNRACAATQKAH